MENGPPNICSTCKRPPIIESEPGALASFLLADLSCQCQSLLAGSRNSAANSSLCLRCRKLVPTLNRLGSMTAFFFKEQRCHCKAPLLANKKSTDEQNKPNFLYTRFHGGEKLKARTRSRTMRNTRLAAEVAIASAGNSMASLQAGQVIGGYKLLELAGQGGMGTVFRAKHIALDRLCAIKFLNPRMISLENWRLFQKEAKINSTLQHRTICQVYDLGIHDGHLPFYSMDFVVGETLEETISQRGPLSVGATLELYLKICEGLSYAHRHGIVHKDLKPANFMLTTSDGRGADVRILDFGIAEMNEEAVARYTSAKAKQKETENSPSEDMIIGSASYMSPEQFKGRRVDKRSDIYSLGCSMFETLTGSPPFLAESFEILEHLHKTAVPPSLAERTGLSYPLNLEAIIGKCLEKDPERRYQNINELAIDLERVQQGKEIQFARDSIKIIKETVTSSQSPSNSSALTNTILIGAVSGGTTAVLLMGAGLFALKNIETSDKERNTHSAHTGKAEDTRDKNRDAVEMQTAIIKRQEPQASAPAIAISEDRLPVVGEKLKPAMGSVKIPAQSASKFCLLDIYNGSLLPLNRDAGEVKLSERFQLIYRPEEAEILKESLNSLSSIPMLGIDLRRRTDNTVEDLTAIAAKLPNLQYLAMVSDENRSTLDALSKFPKLYELTMQAGEKERAHLVAPPQVTIFRIIGYNDPLLSDAQADSLQAFIAESHPSFRTQNGEVPGHLITENCDFKTITIDMSNYSYRWAKMTSKNCTYSFNVFSILPLTGLNDYTLVTDGSRPGPSITPRSISEFSVQRNQPKAEQGKGKRLRIFDTTLSDQECSRLKEKLLIDAPAMDVAVDNQIPDKLE